MPASTRFVVAIHVLVSLAVVRDKPMRSEDLAFSVNTNATVIRALLGRLMDAGLTTSQLGNGGGPSWPSQLNRFACSMYTGQSKTVRFSVLIGTDRIKLVSLAGTFRRPCFRSWTMRSRRWKQSLQQ